MTAFIRLHPLLLTLGAIGTLLAGEGPPPVPGSPFAEEAYWATVMNYPRPGNLHGIVNFNATDDYVTGNGLLLENQGVMLQPLVRVTTPLSANPTKWLSTVSLTLGGWATWHSNEDAADPREWQEVDVFGGISAQFARDWTLSTFYSAYLSQTGAFPTAWDLVVALSYDDRRLFGALALHPFVEFKRQTEGSVTVSFVPENRDESYSFRLGVAPSRQFKHFRIELPAFVTLVPEGFYQRSSTKTETGLFYAYDPYYLVYYPVPYTYEVHDGQPAQGGIGFLSAAMKATVPVEVLSSQQVHTAVYGAVQFYHFVNEGLIEGNQALAGTSSREEDLVQFHVGVTVSF